MSRPLTVVVSGLGIAQIISWGSLYYPIAVLGERMQQDLQVSSSILFAAFTLSLSISGLAAPAVGRLMEAHGARMVLCSGSVMAMLALCLLAAASGPLSLFAAAVLAGCAMSACLYDAGFMALNQIAGDAYRRSVTGLTLFGGFASTVSWPASQWLMAMAGWRHALFFYALLQLLVCLPLHACLLPGNGRKPGSLPDRPAATGQAPHIAWLALAFASGSFVLSVLSVHLIGMFRTSGLSDAQAVTIAALVGPTQVLGRLLELGMGRNTRAVHVGSLTFAAMILGMTALFLLDGSTRLAYLVAALYGISNGLMTIVRGIVPAELYGRRDYTTLLGRLARPAFIARALAPFGFTLALASLGQVSTMLMLLAISIVATMAYWLAVRHARRWEIKRDTD
ncbi:MFS transporter [Noviherbaspirillum soli]|uniref:MFS transporter n=1 Tax=Noviherbaspirillum soli TaxID=1064518 RepID=UPI00188D8CFD|nr:MFS transporter [Noviherbaspirillum soli]